MGTVNKEEFYMATPTKEKKPLPEREIVQVGKAQNAAPAAAKAEKTAAPAAKTDDKAAATQPAGNNAATEKKSAAPMRIAAGLLWLLGCGGTVMAVIMLMESNTTLTIVGLAIMAVMAIVGSLLWKRANRIKPCPVKQDGSTGAKIKTFLWNQMGLVATFVIFLPIGLVLLISNKKLDPKLKKLVAIVAAVLVVGVGAVAADYNAPVAEIPDSQKVEASEVTVPDGTVLTGALTDPAYWTQYGKSYHFDVNCRAIIRSLKIYSGTLGDAIEAKKLDPCDFCANG